MIKKLLLFSISALALFSSCERNYDLLNENNKWQYVDSTQNGFLKVVHAYAPLTPTLAGTNGPKVLVIMDTTRLLRDSLAYNATFPAPSGQYSVIPAGSHNFFYSISRPVANPNPVAGDTIFRSTLNVAAGKRYTSFLVDSVQSPGVYTVEDNYSIPPLGQYQVRFTNLIANPNERYDLYADSVGQMVATNIGYREISNWVNVPIPPSTESYSVRRAGTTTVVYTTTGFSPTTQRVYTFYTRGRVGVAGRTPGVTFYTNR
jgi:hypothetical protein